MGVEEIGLCRDRPQDRLVGLRGIEQGVVVSLGENVVEHLHNHHGARGVGALLSDDGVQLIDV